MTWNSIIDSIRHWVSDWSDESAAGCVEAAVRTSF
ncbi:hypothetical protein QE449_003111 [Rhodococcus sp. SORGH_AS303]|jgi:hypothetical protein|nr:hypothetical protein [Rhodococcus sp. SORGH_AS_0301]MDQ1202493.1 hypothetical protein [Rhodococcus sp. SORGH_AS_0303]